MIDLKKLAALVLLVVIAVYLARRWQPRCEWFNHSQLNHDKQSVNSSNALCYPVAPIVFKTITLGWDHSCAIKHGDVWCWGYSRVGASSVPRRLSYIRNSRLTQISTCYHRDYGFTCLLDRGGTMHCGSLRREMQRMPGRWYTVGVGRDHMCAIDLDRNLWCYAHGQIGNPLGMPYPVSLKNTHTDDEIFDTWAALAVGYNHTCGLDHKGELYCWGLNSKGQLGDGTAEDSRFRPHVVVGDRWTPRWKSICAGPTYSCGISSVGVAYCWGGGRVVLGDGSEPSKWQREATPLRVRSNVKFVSITCGASHTCALTDDGNAYCWGWNDVKQALPHLSKDLVLTPTLVTGHHGWQELVAGFSHTCGVKKDGSVWCWGKNTFGQLGFESRDEVTEPVKVHQSWPAEEATSLSLQPAEEATSSFNWIKLYRSTKQICFDNLKPVVLVVLCLAVLWMWWTSPRPGTSQPTGKLSESPKRTSRTECDAGEEIEHERPVCHKIETGSDTAQRIWTGTMLHTFVASPDHPEELSIFQGDIVQVLEEKDDWLLVKEPSGRQGLVPTSHVQLKQQR